MKEYFIKRGYKVNLALGQAAMFEGKQDDIDGSLTGQYDVYRYARELITKYRLRSVLDIGCGCGMKLQNLILPVCQDITGIDELYTIGWCKRHHRFGAWYWDNLETSTLDLGRTFDLIISSDVIEHMVDPDRLLQIIKRYASDKTLIVLSTPERDSTRGKQSFGPPPSPLHAREWSLCEFRQYIGSQFKIVKQFCVESITPLWLQDAGVLEYIPQKVHRRLLWTASNMGIITIAHTQVILAKRTGLDG